MLIGVPFLAVLIGCPQDVSVIKARVDNDSDGYTSEVDCDDARADINPEAEERCDGLDNDCDGAIDTGATDAVAYFPDVDGDGHGDTAQRIDACEPLDGYIALGDDCDDAESRAFPGADEVCDGVDNDCDGAVDNEPLDSIRFYQDGDEDSYGDDAVFVDACEAPVGYALTGGDCNDASYAIHPDASEDDCTDPTDYNCDGSVGYADADGDGAPGCTDCDDGDSERSPLLEEICDESNIDEDCDRLSDDADDSVSAASMLTWYRDVDNDGYSSGTGLSLVQCEPTPGYAAIDGDCDDYDASISPGLPEVCDAYNTDEDCSGLADDEDPYTLAASFIPYYDDLDTDGYGDPARTASQCEAPAGYVVDDSDCDDTDADRNPGASEVCDSAAKDEDCDGYADDADPSAIGATTWYVDSDSDGYGEPSAIRNACVSPAGYAATSDDCNDSSASINPGADEVCDTADLDEDCSGYADDEDPGVSAAGLTNFYRDSDGDGYGGSYVLALCDAPATFTDNADDCDDADGSTYPGAAVSEDPFLCTRDADHDGYGDASTSGSVDAGDDCDDGDSSVSPAGTEDCGTAADDDCDSSTNDEDAEDCVNYWADTDVDGYGNSADAACFCEPSGVYTVSTTTAADCDDTEVNVHPNAAEVCDAANVDEDCDGSSDDLDASVSASTKTAFYTDNDSDGFGTEVSPTTRCDLAAGYAASDTDCDDADAQAFPGAAPLDSTTACMADDDLDDYGDSSPTSGSAGTDCDDTRARVSPSSVETCVTSYDDDCDGSTNDEAAIDCIDYYHDDDSDGYGAGSSVCTCETTVSYTSTVSTDCDDAATTVNPDAVELCGDAADNNCDGVIDDGCPTFAYSGIYSAEDAVATDANAVYYGSAASDLLGSAIATGVDFDGDGAEDLAVGASAALYSGSYRGAVYVYNGFPVADADAATDAVAIRYGSTSASTTWGTALWALPDFNDDGEDELAASFTSGTNSYVYIYKGANVSTTAGYGSSYYDVIAATGPASGVGDENATYGSNEVAIANQTANSSQGSVTLYTYGASALTSLYVINGEDASDGAGHGLAGGAGSDTNGDGYDDVFIGAWGDDDGGGNTGAAYVVEAPVTGTYDLSSAPVKIIGTTTSETFGWFVGAPGDVDGDGYADMLVTAPRDDGGGSNAGAICIYEDVNTDAATKDSQNSDYEVKILGQTTSDYLGYWEPALGDVNGDGELDILIGSPNWDASSTVTGSGAAWLIYGPLSGVYDLGVTDDYDAVFTGDQTSDACGTTVGIADLDLDGLDDMMLGCTGGDYPSRSGAGTLYFFAGG